jgi:hypothetical protein
MFFKILKTQETLLISMYVCRVCIKGTTERFSNVVAEEALRMYVP